MKNIRQAAAMIALAVLAAAGAAALEAPVAVRPTWGVLIETVADTASPAFSPGLDFNFGAGVIMPFTPDSNFTFVPSADFYYYNAALNSKGRAVPAELSQSSAFVLGLLLDAPVIYNLPLGRFSLGAGLGLCLDLRVAFSVGALGAADTPAINGYLWDKARFLMPSVTLRGEYQLTDRVAFGIKSRMLVPVYNLWAGEGTGFFDHAKYLVDLAILYKLGGAPPAAPVPEPELPAPAAPQAPAPPVPAQQP